METLKCLIINYQLVVLFVFGIRNDSVERKHIAEQNNHSNDNTQLELTEAIIAVVLLVNVLPFAKYGRAQFCEVNVAIHPKYRS